MKDLGKDYGLMQDMIFRVKYSCSQIIKELSKIQKEINCL